ncbi:uncharacterized protein LOC124441784 [Xenia sp. Carnegie-2017]|uniref:uncharacterized protein LOC124441784 n=1 Tax=Xenia sp. Carnegie-2017 TaxID=2897299 RepID=UPI001F0470FE|nr:uncharacterized protein LOC124441784 [Xenia sp. Carnegie-2017]
MVLKSLLLLVLAAYCQAASSRVENSLCLKIYSARYGYVSRYGPYNDLDLLEFSKTKPAAVFKVIPTRILQEIKSQKCVHRITNTNMQLVLKHDCSNGLLNPVDKWMYNDFKLQDYTAPGAPCWSPWNYQGRDPPAVKFVPGLSTCAEYNKINLVIVSCPDASSDEFHSQKY